MVSAAAPVEGVGVEVAPGDLVTGGVTGVDVEEEGTGVAADVPGVIVAAAAAAAASVFSVFSFSFSDLTVSSTLDDAWPYTSADRWMCRCPRVAQRLLWLSWNRSSRFEESNGTVADASRRWTGVVVVGGN